MTTTTTNDTKTKSYKNQNPFYNETVDDSNLLMERISLCIASPTNEEDINNDSKIKINTAFSRQESHSYTRRRKNYMDGIRELVRINDKYPYTYISNLMYSEKTYNTFREAMETKAASPIDLFVHSITFRAEAINNGYQTLTEHGNYLCAIALIRMQLDNFLIAWAGLACKNRDEFYVAYQSGKPINKLTDKEGKLLTQNFIVNSYAEIDPLVKEIYQNGNDFIHPSHIFMEHSIDLTNGIRMQSYKEYECPEPMKREAKIHMMIANNLLCNILCRWVQLKHGVDLGISKMEQVENDLGVRDTQESPDDLPF